MSGPILTTERLGLWPLRADDLAGIHALTETEESRRFLGDHTRDLPDSFARLLRNAGSWQLYGYGNLVVRPHGEPGIAGICGLFHSFRGFGQGMDDVPEAGWVIAPGHWGKGFAAEAMAAVLVWFDAKFGARRTVCMIEQGHTASERVAEKLGYRPYGRRETAEDGDVPVVLYERVSSVIEPRQSIRESSSGPGRCNSP